MLSMHYGAYMHKRDNIYKESIIFYTTTRSDNNNGNKISDERERMMKILEELLKRKEQLA